MLGAVPRSDGIMISTNPCRGDWHGTAESAICNSSIAIEHMPPRNISGIEVYACIAGNCPCGSAFDGRYGNHCCRKCWAGAYIDHVTGAMMTAERETCVTDTVETIIEMTVTVAAAVAPATWSQSFAAKDSASPIALVSPSSASCLCADTFSTLGALTKRLMYLYTHVRARVCG